MWIDSHCHLTHDRIAGLGPPAAIADAAYGAGVDGLLTISCQITGDFPDQLAVAKAHKNVWCSIGTHPHDAGNTQEQAVSQADIVETVRAEPKIIGIGESGLDYYYNNSSPEDQAASFRKHIRACLETDLPLIVHSREAEEDTIKIIKEESAGQPLKGVMHCFSSRRVLAEDALDLGFYISFSGIVTFKQSDDLRAVAKDIPLDRILVETDAPFLAPTPMRGKTNQPAYVTLTGKYLAEFLEQPEKSFAKQTTQNFFRLFDRAVFDPA